MTPSRLVHVQKMLRSNAVRVASRCSRSACTRRRSRAASSPRVPVQGVSRVKPNIMLTIDDSGSMLWDFVPDYAAFAGPGISHCRDGTVAPVFNAAA